MGQTTGISWTHHTFNPWIGCSKVHAGCAHCYAERDFDTRRGVAKWGPSGTRIKTTYDYWKQPQRWNSLAEVAGERRRVFCASLADVFEDWQGPILDNRGRVLTHSTIETAGMDWRNLTMNDLRADLFELIDATPWVDWLLLTKRPENIGNMWPKPHPQKLEGLRPLYRHNVWLGTSISDQETADEFVPRLLKCRDLSPVLFLSAEPLLGPIQLSSYFDAAGNLVVTQGIGCDWVIAGGESGPGFRRMEASWARSLRYQCEVDGVPFFFKQWGGVRPKDHCDELDGRAWHEFPSVSTIGV